MKKRRFLRSGDYPITIEYDYADVCRQVDELVASSVEEDDMEIVKRMKEMVPEFKSKHSVYEVLDK